MSQQLALQRLDFDGVREEFPDRWARAKEADASVDRLEDELWSIEFADGEAEHEAVLYEDREGAVGFCDCDGASYHEGPCAHLCRLKMFVALGNVDLPTPPADVHLQDDVVDDVQEEDDEDVDEPEADPEDAPIEPVEPRDVATVAGPDPQKIEDPEEFVTEISGVPPAFVVDMGRGATSKPYITKEGLNYIARQQGIETRAEEISPSWEEPTDMAAYRGIAVDADGRRYEDVGTAHADAVEDTVGQENLDELASTRATNRALRLATGAGFASMEEVTGEDPTLGADQEVVDERGHG